MQQLDKKRDVARKSWMEGQQAEQQQIDERASALINKISDRDSRRHSELQRQVSAAREKNLR